MKAPQPQTRDVPSPAWLPAGIRLERLPEPLRLALETVVGPLYEDVVLQSGDPLQRAAGLVLARLAGLEILENYRALGDDPAGYLRLVHAALHVTRFLVNLREFHARQAVTPTAEFMNAEKPPVVDQKVGWDERIPPNGSAHPGGLDSDRYGTAENRALSHQKPAQRNPPRCNWWDSAGGQRQGNLASTATRTGTVTRTPRAARSSHPTAYLAPCGLSPSWRTPVFQESEDRSPGRKSSPRLRFRTSIKKCLHTPQEFAEYKRPLRHLCSWRARSGEALRLPMAPWGWLFDARREKAAIFSGWKSRPARSLQPVVVGAVEEVTNLLRPSMEKGCLGQFSEQAGWNASER